MWGISNGESIKMTEHKFKTHPDFFEICCCDKCGMSRVLLPKTNDYVYFESFPQCYQSIPELDCSVQIMKKALK